MQPSVRDLSRFYNSRLGQMAKLCIDRRLSSLWPDLSGLDILTLGYGAAYANAWQTTARRLVCAMPSRQGVEQWPQIGPVQSILVDPQELPFVENSFDRILVIHFLEETADPLQSMIQITRALSPGGRVTVIVPHRVGLWSSNSGTPFGHGRSFSYHQVQNLLDQVGLKCTARTQALFAPPHSWFAKPTSARAWERTGEVFWPFFGGVLLVEAQKLRMIDPRKRPPLPVFCPESR